MTASRLEAVKLDLGTWENIHEGESLQQVIVERSKSIPAGIHAHRFHVIVRLGSDASFGFNSTTRRRISMTHTEF